MLAKYQRATTVFLLAAILSTKFTARPRAASKVLIINDVCIAAQWELVMTVNSRLLNQLQECNNQIIHRIIIV